MAPPRKNKATKDPAAPKRKYTRRAKPEAGAAKSPAPKAETTQQDADTSITSMHLRLTALGQAVTFGRDAGLDLNAWVPFVLGAYGGFAPEQVTQFYPNGTYTAPRAAHINLSTGNGAVAPAEALVTSGAEAAALSP